MNLSEILPFGKSSINYAEKLYIKADKYGGAVTHRCKSLSSYVTANVRGNSRYDVVISLISFDESETENVVMSECLSPSANGDFEFVYDFDPIGLGIYKKAVSFELRILSDCDNAEFELHHISFDECENVDFSNNGDYSALIKDDMGNLSVRVIQTDKSEKLVPAVPDKVLFVGNSILLGMHTVYGMCSSAPDKDYAHYVTEHIKKLNDNCSFSKLSGSDFELSESKTMYEDWLYNNNNSKTGKPAICSFEDDIGIIILQLGDNVKDDKKRAVFKDNAEDFIRTIKSKSPVARLVWVFGWYGTRQVFEDIADLTSRWGIETVYIRHLYKKENQSELGMTYYNPETNDMSVVKDTWITHPGDKGMKLIADEIINKLGI